MFGPRIQLPDLQRGAEALALYDATGAAAAIGGLQLLPGTACHLGRLEAAASTAASQRCEEGATPALPGAPPLGAQQRAVQ
jgi:hypothetical protein